MFPVSETFARFNDPHGFNHFTSACSPAIYRDDLLGPEVAGNIFVCEPVHNLVHRERVSAVGSSFVGERPEGEKESEFLRRPICGRGSRLRGRVRTERCISRICIGW